MVERFTIEKQAIDRAYADLAGHGIKCDKIARDGKVRAGVRGMYKGFPFLVYVNIVGKPNSFAGVVATRYKSRDWGGKSPLEILRQEG